MRPVSSIASALALAAGLSFPLIARASVPPEPEVRFDAHRVIKVHVNTMRELNTVLALTHDVWACGGVGLGSFDVRVSPEEYGQLVAHGIQHDLVINNVQELIDAEKSRLELNAPWQPGGAPDAGFFDDFHTYDEIKAYFQTLAATYPTLATYEVLGKSLENRDIFGLRISGPGNSPARPAYLIQGTQHAREWGNTSCTVYHADALLTQYATNPTVKSLVDSLEFIVVPIVNPDGYVYTWGPNRLWRKNRRDNGGGCFGVDPNRNWGYEWVGGGSSTDPCSETYRGPSAFSEPETQVMRDFTIANTKIKAAMDFHSFSQLILWPWGYTNAFSPDQAKFNTIGLNMQAAIKSKYNKTYDAGPVYTTIYPVNGGAVDWWYGARNILGYSIEVRDTGGYGFIMPPAEIIPNAEENFAASIALATALAQPVNMSLLTPVPGYIAPETPTPMQAKIEPGTGTIKPGSATIHTRVGTSGPFTPSSMTDQGNNVYQGNIQPAPCFSDVQFYFSVETTDNKVWNLPLAGPSAPYQTKAIQQVVKYEDTAEVNQGWTVGAPGDTAISGVWNRMDPQPTAAQPGDDHTPTPGVNCWVTDGNAGSQIGSFDVDGGATTLTSPTIDASGLVGDVFISYWRWYSNDQGGAPNTDSMPISISSNNGATWTQLELVTENANAWVNKQFNLTTLGISPTSQMKLRLVARDEGTGSIIEAGVDDVQLFALGCPTSGCYADCDSSGTLAIDDFICFQTLFAIGDPYADCDSSGTLNIDDFICFQTFFALGC